MRQKYATEAEARRARFEQRRDRNRGIIRQAKDVPCADCGQRYPYYVMDFDHRDEKHAVIGWMGYAGRGRLEAEIALCDVVCSNCHRERTHQRQYQRTPGDRSMDASQRAGHATLKRMNKEMR